MSESTFHLYIAECRECGDSLNGDEDVWCKACWDAMGALDAALNGNNR